MSATDNVQGISITERRIMEHATAWKHKRRLYRNYFVAGPDHMDWSVLQELCERGLMHVRRGPSDIMGGMTIFSVTDAGIAALGACQ